MQNAVQKICSHLLHHNLTSEAVRLLVRPLVKHITLYKLLEGVKELSEYRPVRSKIMADLGTVQ